MSVKYAGKTEPAAKQKEMAPSLPAVQVPFYALIFTKNNSQQVFTKTVNGL